MVGGADSAPSKQIGLSLREGKEKLIFDVNPLILL